MVFKTHPIFKKYVGAWKEGSFEGYGQLNMKADEEYKGHWSKGDRAGLGCHTYQKVCPFATYKGNWTADHYSGVGTLV